MEILIRAVLISAFSVVVLFAFSQRSLKRLIFSGLFSVIFFLGLQFFKILPLFKIGVNLFTLVTVFFLSFPGMISLLFFNILSLL